MEKISNFLSFRKNLNNPDWVSAYVQLLLLLVTIASLFLTNIKEIFVIKNLNEKKVIQEKELLNLKELQKQYVLNLGNAIIDNLIQQLEKEYKNIRFLNEKLFTMKELEELTKECMNGLLEEDERNEPLEFDANIASYLFLEYRKSIINNLDHICSSHEDSDPIKKNLVKAFNQQKDFFLQKNNQYGYELINSLSITLLPNSDKIKLENFLNNYSKKTIYQKPIYLRLSKWEYAHIKENSTISQKNISDLENDLPNLKIKLKEFFNNL